MDTSTTSIINAMVRSSKQACPSWQIRSLQKNTIVLDQHEFQDNHQHSQSILRSVQQKVQKLPQNTLYNNFRTNIEPITISMPIFSEYYHLTPFSPPTIQTRRNDSGWHRTSQTSARWSLGLTLMECVLMRYPCPIKPAKFQRVLGCVRSERIWGYISKVVATQIFVIFTLKIGEMIQFDEHIFSNGLFQPPTSHEWSQEVSYVLLKY